MSWAQRLKRVFDIESCLDCGGKIKVIAIIEDYTVAKKILTHIGLDSKALHHDLQEFSPDRRGLYFYLKNIKNLFSRVLLILRGTSLSK